MNPGPLAVVASQDGRQSSLFASGIAIAVYVALARIVLFCIAGPHYGYFRDELYYLACGEHPAWGYVDQPPLIAWVAWLLQHSIGTSLWALRLLPALAGAGTIVLTGALTRSLGGRRWAIFLASLGALLTPVLLIFSHLFAMNAFDPLLWTAIACVVVRLAQSGREPLWLAVGALVGVTILNKYGVLFWLSGLLIGVCLTPLRHSFGHVWIWLGCALTAAISLPNFLWQWQHEFPFLQLMHNIRAHGRDIALGPLSFLLAQAHMLGFVTALFVPFALLYFFSKAGRSVRALGWAYLVFLAEMMLLHGKMYYVAPVYPMIFAAGAVGLEAVASSRRWSWAKPVLAVSIVNAGIVSAPLVLPVLSVPAFLAYERMTGIQSQKFEHQPDGVLPQVYADMFGWEQVAQTVAAYYHTLSPEEQRKTAIFANNYGDAGAIDFFGPRYGLPKAIGNHQNYWIWGPREFTGESIIVLGEGHESNMQSKCASYSIIGNTMNPLSRPDEWQPIYHCRGFKWNLKEKWPEMKHWD